MAVAILAPMLATTLTSLALAFSMALPLQAQELRGSGNPGAPVAGKMAEPPPAPPKQLDRLFDRLSAAKSDAEAKGVAALITRRWARSGSDTADLLMARMQKAAQSQDFNLAVELADRIIALEPDWAEGWNQRANLFFRMDDPARALFDVAETLKREPRHFGAWGGLATLLQQQGNDKAALRAYRELIKLYPRMEGARQAIERLAPAIDGRDA